MQFRSHHIGEESNNSYAVKIETLVREIIIQNEIPYYRIESGVEHLTSAGAEENLPVVRVITYFEDTVNEISDILHREFDVDDVSSDNKRIRIETFAYKNINYTARLTAARQNQTEYKRSGNKKFEIQICSMLQDAWTGIEKELGYDSDFVPDTAKRDIYRVGALLEMADIEFLKIRSGLSRKKNPDSVAETVAPAQDLVLEEKIGLPLIVEEIHEEQFEEHDLEPMAEAEAAPEAFIDKNANEFLEHLQAIAREVQKDAHIPPVQVTAEKFPEVVPPVHEVIESETAPMPVMEEQDYTPAPQLEQPAYEQPAPVEQPVIVQPAMVAVQSPAAQQVAQSIVPKRVPNPASPTGIAPKPISIPRPEPVHNRFATDSEVNKLKELANSINKSESKINNAESKVVPPPPAPMQEPVASREPASVIPPASAPAITELPIPPVQETIRQATVPPAPQPQPAPAMPVAETFSSINVNNNGVIQIAELNRDNNSTDKTVPLYNGSDQPKPVKAIQLDENAHMTDLTLRDFVLTSKLVKEIDQKIAERAGAKINADIDIEGDVERLRFLKVYTLKQLQDRLTDNKEDIVAFAEKWIGKDNGGSFDSGICLFYLEYLLVGKRNDPAFAVEYVVKFISDNDYSARYIIPTYNSIHNTEAPNFSHLTLRA